MYTFKAMPDLFDPANARWTFTDARCAERDGSQPLLLQTLSLHASAVLLGGFLCFSKGGKLWRSSLPERYVPRWWQDGICLLTARIVLRCTTSQGYALV